jgi:hypothetical protein
MTMIKTDGIEIEGKFGGVIFRTDQCGQHMQSEPRDVYEGPTYKQLIRQNAFRTCINYIRIHSTPDWVFAWQIYADNHPRKNKKGNVYSVPWWQQFVSTNINRIVNNEPILDLPPE